MANGLNTPSQIPKLHSEESIDLIKFFFLFLHHWYYFFISIVITVGLAYFYIKYTMPVYRVTSTLLVIEDNQSPVLDANSMLNGFGLNPGMQSLDNQINILSSFSMIKRCIKNLPFEINYYTKGKINEATLYRHSPFKVIPDSLCFLPYKVEFLIHFLGNEKFEIVADENENFKFSKISKFGETLIVAGGRFSLEKNLDYWKSVSFEKKYYFSFQNYEDLAMGYQERLKISPVSPEGTIISLSLEGIDPKKDQDFLIKLIEVYLTYNMDKKNQEANRTISFIDEQLKGISDSLIIAETKLQEFRSKNRVMNISDQGSQVLDQAVRLEDEKSRLMIQADYYNYLNEYLSKDQVTDKVIAPATMGITDPSLVNLVEQLAQLQSEYYSLGGGSRNPLQANLRIRIENTKKALVETLKSIIRSNNYALSENRARLRELNKKAEALPETERKLLGIQRGFKLNDNLYTFLLQKRAEAQIQKASNTSDIEIIDSPRILPRPISPRTLLSFIIAVMFGILLPALFLLVQNALNNKVSSDEDIYSITNVPIAGHILHNKKPHQKVVFLDSSSDIAESFRSLRTRLRFFSKDIESPVILLTSAMPGEGKTFISMNLASAYSLEQKKTILVGFDLRRPKLCEDFELHNNAGISSFLIGKDSIDQIIQHTDYPNFDIIPSGPISPNPTELIASSKTEKLIKELRNRYNCIILDTAPIGTVSDSFYLANHSDINILVVRNRVTIKNQLELTLSDLNSVDIRELTLVVNDIVAKKGYSSYSYRYRYSKGKK